MDAKGKTTKEILDEYRRTKAAIDAAVEGHRNTMLLLKTDNLIPEFDYEDAAKEMRANASRLIAYAQQLAALDSVKRVMRGR